MGIGGVCAGGRRARGFLKAANCLCVAWSPVKDTAVYLHVLCEQPGLPLPA